MTFCESEKDLSNEWRIKIKTADIRFKKFENEPDANRLVSAINDCAKKHESNKDCIVTHNGISVSFKCSLPPEFWLSIEDLENFDNNTLVTILQKKAEDIQAAIDSYEAE